MESTLTSSPWSFAPSVGLSLVFWLSSLLLLLSVGGSLSRWVLSSSRAVSVMGGAGVVDCALDRVSCSSLFRKRTVCSSTFFGLRSVRVERM